MAQDFGALTDMWMLNPWMFDPTQNSNKFSSFNDAPLPGPSYNTGPTGGVANAATGKPIASFAAWQAANPGGMNINATPTAPAPAAAGAGAYPPGSVGSTPAIQELLSNYAAAHAGQQQTPYGGAGTNPFATAYAGGATPQQLAGMFSQMSPTIPSYTDTGLRGGQATPSPGGVPNPNYAALMGQLMAGAGQPAAPAAAQPSAGGAPNNWMAALNALANPGNPTTPGAAVPMASGYQPAGGVNQAFLGQAGGGNSNFLSALAAIQKRPQGVA